MTGNGKCTIAPSLHHCTFPAPVHHLTSLHQVVKGEAVGIVPWESATVVAVKMIKPAADLSYLKALMSELKIMVHLGRCPSTRTSTTTVTTTKITPTTDLKPPPQPQQPSPGTSTLSTCWAPAPLTSGTASCLWSLNIAGIFFLFSLLFVTSPHQVR